ncbi:MAG TPA: hypothetical protein PLT66_01145 [Bacillota bacterium]|nr:hypothetical protein [Bacillota bacterium]
MTKRNNLKNAADHPSKDAFLTNPVASVNECTGFVPTPPETQHEASAYSELADVPVTKNEKPNRRKKL